MECMTCASSGFEVVASMTGSLSTLALVELADPG